MENIEIHTDSIHLDQLLKWAGVISSGGQIRDMLDEQMIKVNGNLVTERRKKICPGDIVEISAIGIWKVCKVQGE